MFSITSLTYDFSIAVKNALLLNYRRLAKARPLNYSFLAEFSFLLRSRADEYGKRDLPPGSKLTVLSMRGGYLASEPSRDTSFCVGSLNNSGITVKECAEHRGLKSPSANISWGIRFEECRPMLWTAVGSRWISTSASREGRYATFNQKLLLYQYRPCHLRWEWSHDHKHI